MLYIFGDSFAEYEDNIDWLWTDLVAATLGHDRTNFSRGGSGLEYTFEQFEQCRASITQDDLVIICLTEATRVYFFKDFLLIKVYFFLLLIFYVLIYFFFLFQNFK